MAWLVNDFAVPSPLLFCLLLDLACEAYKAVRAAFAACRSARLASDRADLDFLPIVVFPFRFWFRSRSTTDESNNYLMNRARASAFASCAS